MKNAKQGSHMTFGFLDFLRANRARASAQAILSIAGGVVEASILALFATAAVGSVLDVEQKDGFLSQYVSTPKQIILVLLGAILVRFILGAYSAFLSTGISQNITLNLRRQLIESYASASWIGQIGLSDGALQQLVVDLPNKASAAFLSLLKSGANVLTLLAMVTVAGFSDVRLTAILLLGVL